MKIPIPPIPIFGLELNIHLILEYLAFFVAFRYYIYLRKHSTDTISTNNRLSIIIGATLGGLIGSRMMGYLENPITIDSIQLVLQLFNAKTIMGGLFGGMIGVEIAKKIIGEKQSSGDLFTFPIIVGLIIGRVGCFLTGINEFTYGKPTKLFMGMDLGDGLMRHPVALYEIIFLIILLVFLKIIKPKIQSQSGLLFKIFMISYFGFRFFIEFLKPNNFYLAGLSSIQWLCIVCWIYYLPTIKNLFKNAH